MQMLDGTGDGDKPARLCVALTDDKASERLLAAVVKELCVWHPSGVLAELHLVHCAFAPTEYLDRFNEDVKDFMEKRFMSLLNQLPDTLDWRLHIVALTQKTFSGEAVRKARTADQKRLLASALCQEAEKIGATELVVCDKGRSDHLQSSVAHKAIKYSKIKVRVIGAHGPKVYDGKGRDPHTALYREGSNPEPLPDVEAKYPEDTSDVYSRYKSVKRSFNKLFVRHHRSHSGTSQLEFELAERS